jgi:chromate reductase
MTDLLAISGSLRASSTNTALLHALARVAEPPVQVTVWSGLAELPAFSPDQEGEATPDPILRLAERIDKADGLIVACPEYVHSLPGAFKNAIDWMVSRPEIIAKPIAILHASHRGGDVLEQLRIVLSTVSDRFLPDVFAQVPLISRSASDVQSICATPEVRGRLLEFLSQLVEEIENNGVSGR